MAASTSHMEALTESGENDYLYNAIVSKDDSEDKIIKIDEIDIELNPIWSDYSSGLKVIPFTRENPVSNLATPRKW